MFDLGHAWNPALNRLFQATCLLQSAKTNVIPAWITVSHKIAWGSGVGFTQNRFETRCNSQVVDNFPSTIRSMIWGQHFGGAYIVGGSVSVGAMAKRNAWDLIGWPRSCFFSKKSTTSKSPGITKYIFWKSRRAKLVTETCVRASQTRFFWNAI